MPVKWGGGGGGGVLPYINMGYIGMCCCEGLMGFKQFTLV